MSFLLFSAVIWGCTAPKVTQGLITINITADRNDIQLKIAAGSKVQEALKSAQIVLDELDRVDPPLYAVLSDDAQVKVTRVREEYYIEQKVIAFEHHELNNEAFPEGERRLSQSGVNGLEEITYHRVFEDDIEISNNIVKSVVLKNAIPEVIMIGSQSSFTTFKIPGRIAYLSMGNAWVMDNFSGNRRLVAATGDLDGRIFSLSDDGNLLLFSRFSSSNNTINSLWVALLQNDPAKIIDLGVSNIIHFAEFNPDSTIITYSTAEWRESAPGWQANNDLYELGINEGGFFSSPRQELDANSGGVYGWWGMEFSWAPDSVQLLYSRPDGIGILDRRHGSLTSILQIEPYQTGGNWAWVPGAAWSPDGDVIYTVDHFPSDGSQQFNLIAVPLSGGLPVQLVENVGMFAYPVPSPVQQVTDFMNTTAGINIDQDSYSIAYLQAILPDQSDACGYQLFVIDRDGSNMKSLFPEAGAAGLDPQQVVWSPDPLGSERELTIAFIYDGNIWLVNSTSGFAKQITGDGLTSRIDWR